MTSSTSVKHCSNRRSNDDNEKYSLRQRHKRSTVRSKLSQFDNNAKSSSLDSSSLLLSSSSSSSSSFDDNFEVITKTVASGSSALTKNKTKAPPLSKYRRKTANARERTRMKEINSAFEVLRKCVPQAVSGSGDNKESNEKLTKITTLRLAMTYINILSNALEDNTPFDLPPRIQGEQDHIFEEIDDHSYCSSDHLVEVNKVHGKRNAKTSNKKPKKRQTKTEKQQQQKQKQQAKQKDVSSSLSPTLFNVNVNTTTSSSAIMMNDYHSINSILLESDGESLHLSETCLSPLSNGFNSLTPTSISSLSSAASPSSSSSASSSSHLNNPLELKLLLETEQHHPPSLSCISPLETLDTFNPFSDLLYTEFSDFYLT
ncbi:hypothetical protein ACFFRR_000014 [Megaselia abdita]